MRKGVGSHTQFAYQIAYKGLRNQLLELKNP